MKRWWLGIVIVILLIATYLLLFSLTSTAHVAARNAIERSQRVRLFTGRVSHVLVVGVRQKLSPDGISCTAATYAVLGDAGFSFVVVDLTQHAGQRQWVVDDVSPGWFGTPASRC